MNRRSKSHHIRLAVRTVAALIALSGLSARAEMSGTKADQPAASEIATNALGPLSKIPQSVFIVPTNDKEGKDPFFPDSAPQYTSVTPIKSGDAGASSVELVLQGISGQADKRMAVINNRNLGQGEEVYVPTPSGPIRIHCIEIKTNSVVVEIGNERRELRLRQGP